MQNSIKRGRPSKQKLVVEFDSKSLKSPNKNNM